MELIKWGIVLIIGMLALVTLMWMIESIICKDIEFFVVTLIMLSTLVLWEYVIITR